MEHAPLHTRPAPAAPPLALPSLIGRSDIATVPWLTTALFCVGVIITTLLQPEQRQVPSAIVIGAAGVYALTSAAILALQHTRFVQWCATRVEVYVLGGAFFIGVMSLWAALGHGVVSPFFSWPTALVGMYLGLVLPTRWALQIAAAQAAGAVAVQLAQPAAHPMDAMPVVILLGAGWGGGLVCRAAHARTARSALLLSRTDLLTHTLNRRGFLEELDELTGRAARTRQPLALLMLDLHDLARVNESSGSAAGDDLLRWVGEQLAALTPREASVGRLSGDDFGICLPATREEAQTLAARLVEAIGERIDVRVGLAVASDGATSSDALLHTADLALQTAQTTTPGGRLVSQEVEAATPSSDDARRASVALPYARLRALPRIATAQVSEMDLRAPIRAALLLMSAGTVLMVAGLLAEPRAGIPPVAALGVGGTWALLLAAAAVALRHPAMRTSGAQQRAYAGLSVPFGIGTVAIAAISGGIGTPIGAIFALKLLADAVVLPAPLARRNGLLVAPWLAAAVAMSPTAALATLPLLATVMTAAWLYGRVGRAALHDSTSATICATRTDPLTGLLNRQGFEYCAAEALESAKRTDQPFGLLAFDLEGLKAVNRAWGHAAGDDLLRRIAEITRLTLPEALHLARRDGDEFMVALPLESADDAMHAAEHLEDALQLEAFAFVGWSLLFDDGFTLESLTDAARRRAERARLQRPRLARAASAAIAGASQASSSAAQHHRAA